MRKVIIDIECDGLLDTITKIHCLSYCYEGETDVRSIVSYEGMKEFLNGEITIVGHNFKRFDIVALERILGVRFAGKIIDTLALSWYLEPERNKHGLAEYGEEFGIPKVAIDDWQNLSVEEYVHRCSEDVRINNRLWQKQYNYLFNLYEGDEQQLQRFLNYIEFKLDCIREQEEIGIKLDIDHCKSMLSQLSAEKEAKLSELTVAMPKRALIDVRSRPKIMVKKDGTLSSHGENWVKFLRERGFPDNHEEDVEYIRDWEAGNPNSHDQVKKWLYSLGWEPGHIKHVRDKKKNEVKKIPQIASKEGGGEICDSIKALFPKEPKLELLGGLSILSHRIGIFEGFLRDVKPDGRLYPTIAGLTNTLRMQHSVIVNLPGPGKKYGEEVRACLIANEGCILMGFDLKGIEDTTKRHYIYNYDPEYVKQMDVEGYDSHLELGQLADLLKQEEVDFYKEYEKKRQDIQWKPTKKEEKEFKRIKEIRFKSKTANFNIMYKGGADALARNSNWTVPTARRVIRTFWERNKAILDIERDCYVKEIGARKWLQNSLNGFWYVLRSEKDRFSTLNQSSSAYAFDLWLTYIRRQGFRVGFQYHDEAVMNILLGSEDNAIEAVKNATESLNNKLSLNVLIGFSSAFGQKYSDVH